MDGGLNLHLIIAALSIASLGFITLSKLYLRIRQKFKVRVNCWFCNINFWVPYNNYNCFTCIHCGQYNGFKEDGDYNCLVKAQHHKSLNATTGSVQSEEDISQLPRSNGLCTLCNRNQELKVSQLASYIPEYEDNYDYEIEEYQLKLEQCYKLCGRCERVVKRSLVNVKRNILGSRMAATTLNKTRIEDYNDGLRMVKVERRKSLALQISVYLLFGLAIWNLYLSIGHLNMSKSTLEQVFPPVVVNAVLKTIAYVAAVESLISHYFLDNYFAVVCKMRLEGIRVAFLWTINELGFYQEMKYFFDGVSAVDAISCTAIAFNALLIWACNSTKRERFVFSILSWTASMTLVSATVPDYYKEIIGPITLDLLKLFTSVTNTILAYQCLAIYKVPQNLSSSFQKIENDCTSDISDESEAENDISYASTPKSKSPTVLNESFRRAQSTTSFTSTPRLTPAVLRNFEESQSQHNNSFCGNVKNGFGNKSFLRAPSFLSTSFQPESQPVFGSTKSIFEPEKPSVVYDERFRENVDRLSISGTVFNTEMPQPKRNPFYKVQETSRPQTPTEFSYCVRQRTPPHVAAPVSWVAGGYWTHNSPQKQHKVDPIRENILGFYPIMSRTSSQSSGFESHGHNSRENSVFPDNEGFSVYSESTLAPKSPASSLFDNHRGASKFDFSTRMNSLLPKPNFEPHAYGFRQFGMQRIPTGPPSNPQNFLRKGSIFNLNKINSTLTDS